MGLKNYRIDQTGIAIIKKCKQKRWETKESCMKTCKYENPEDAEIDQLKCLVKFKKEADKKECKKEREEQNKCDKMCPGEDAKDAYLWNLKC